MRARRLSILIALAPLACGGNAPPPPQNAVVTTMPSATITAVPTWDTSPVPMPPNVGIVARVTNASASADKLSRWTRIPLSPLEMLGNDRAARAVDLSKPVDMVVSVDDRRGKPNATVAFSAAVRSLDEARAILSEKNDLVNGENGAVKIVPKKGSAHTDKDPRPVQDADGDGTPDDDDNDDDRKCALAPAFGAAAWRVVCAETDAALAKILPYMTRGVTRINVDQDLHVEAYAAPVRKSITAMHGEISRALSRGSSSALLDLMNAYDPFELALDFDHATLDAKLGDDAGDATVSLVFREKQSSLTKMLVSHPELAGPAPSSFLRLPIDSDVAFYTRGFDAADLEKARTVGGDALAASAQGGTDGLSPSDAQAMGNAFKNTIASLSGPLAYARGVDVVQARAAISAFAAAKDDATKTKLGKAAIELVAGWEIIGLDAPIAKVGPNIKEYAALLARPSIAKTTKDADDLAATTFKASTAIPGLPADSLHFEATFTHAGDMPPPPPQQPGSKIKAPKPVRQPPITTKLHLVVLADQGHTWLVDGMDLPTVTAKAKGLLPGAPDTATLAKRPDIETLRSKNSNAGGFFNMQGIGLDLPISWAGRTPAYVLAGDDPLGGMTNAQQGATAIPFLFTEQTPPAGMQGVLVFSAHVPKEAITDGLTYGSKLF